jgi:hypothetical protein
LLIKKKKFKFLQDIIYIICVDVVMIFVSIYCCCWC